MTMWPDGNISFPIFGHLSNRIWLIVNEIGQTGSKFCKNTKWNCKKLPKLFKVCQHWRNLNKSGHTDNDDHHDPNDWLFTSATFNSTIIICTIVFLMFAIPCVFYIIFHQCLPNKKWRIQRDTNLDRQDTKTNRALPRSFFRWLYQTWNVSKQVK